ncbi:MAG: hypothetical protein ABGZ23_07985 [Fuerstiella sp.]
MVLLLAALESTRESLLDRGIEWQGDPISDMDCDNLDRCQESDFDCVGAVWSS